MSTKQRDRINSDEEERLRYGYQIVNAYRLEEHGGMPSHRVAKLNNDSSKCLAILKYGHGATLWRINKGWNNRPAKSPAGFLLDKGRGAWVTDGHKIHEEAEIDLADPTSASSVERVIPYVEDHENCLVFESAKALTPAEMLSLQAALKQAIQQLYQLEDFEFSTEILPTKGEPRTLLFVESAEGGAGVLRHFVDDPAALSEIAKTALRICHFDAQGKDLGKAEHTGDPCVDACYDCLMNYGNQRVHKDLNRHVIRDILLEIAASKVIKAAPAKSRAHHLEELKKLSSTSLERSWLDFLEKHGLRFPDKAQFRLDICKTVPDFWYGKSRTAIYIDGPCHEFHDRHLRDEEQTECMEDQGIEVIRFANDEQWLAEIKRHPNLFDYKNGKR